MLIQRVLLLCRLTEYLPLKTLLNTGIEFCGERLKKETEKSLKDLAKFPTSANVSSLDSLELVKNMKLVLKTAISRSNQTIARSLFILVRDCILCFLIFNNAIRPDAISNMTLAKFENAVKSAGCFTVRVMEHETDYVGPANIVFDANLYYQNRKYVMFLHNKLVGVDTGRTAQVFVSWMGFTMDSSMICTQLVSFLQDAGKKW